MLHQHQHHHHQQQLKKRSPKPTTTTTTTTTFVDNHQLSFRLSLHSLQARSNRLLQPTRVRKLDSVAGATGTSIPELPGRHILVPPWASIVVYSVILSFLILTGAGFILSWNARREFRRRVAIQKAADALDQPAAPISRKDVKSFTRQSIIQLNSSRNPSTYAPPFRISRAGDLLPINVFDRPTRYSMVVAEVVPSLEQTETDDFYRFSQTAQRPSFWELRKSRAISLSHLAVPQLEITPHDQSTELAEVLDGVSWDRNCHSTFTRTPVRRDPSASSSAPTDHTFHDPPSLVPVALEDAPYHPPNRSTSLHKHRSPSPSGQRTKNSEHLSGQLFQTSRDDSEEPSISHTPTYGLSPTPSYIMRVSESNVDPDQAMADYATNSQRPLSPWASNSSMGHSLNDTTIPSRSTSPLNLPRKLSKRILRRPSNTLRDDSGDGSTRSQTPSSDKRPHLPSLNTMEMRVPEPSSMPVDPDKAMAEYAINRQNSASTAPNPNKGLRMLAKLDEVGFTMVGLDELPMVSSPISQSPSPASLPFQSSLNPSMSMTRKPSVKNLPLIPEQSLSRPRPTLERSGSSAARRNPSLPTLGSSTLAPAPSLVQRSASARIVHRHQRRPMQLESIEETQAKSNHRRSVSLNGLQPKMIPINNTRVRRSPSSSNAPVMTEKVTGNSGIRRPPPRMPLSGTMSSGGVRNSSFVP
ncbi:uncharacterized protein MELLADRAFT_118100 [Melampsora larici-populina 98AG31]|uniref:Uncharacterized protein n=1 Tax=Melampsora larici-populina (strain 98AG31 / pathotype 3-4-7) TaxID=747676 RepID=F4S537_MELLP|nr:uncharacterized protein MELLADRAFT_118100 [Melampsora larici-populina 98AG31]EGG00251.1 hypothetical protein MELLADRAFT_118100 [Melampsora larici-populina 98AG31]